MSKEMVSSVITGLGTLTLVGQVLFSFLVICFLIYSVDKYNKMIKQIIQFFSQNALAFAFLVATVATIGSLFFSEIARFPPCKLCWYQRIFMYPQVILLGIAVYKNDFGVKKYIIPLSIIGLIIAIYHYILQMSPIPLPCTDEIASCAAKQFAQFGYITIPLMSATAFGLIIALFLLGGKGKGRETSK